MLRVAPSAVLLVIASTAVAGALSSSAAAAPAGDAEEPAPAVGDPRPSGPASIPPASAPLDPPPAIDAQAGPADPTANVSNAVPKRFDPAAAVFGVGVRARYVSVPHWFLGLFTKHSVPLSSFGHLGVEAFRRQGNFELSLALSYQNMSPPDGNWLGSGHDPTIDTRFLQFRGLALYSADLSFIWHHMLTSWFGLHGGAGLGIAVVRGSLYIDVSEGCNSTNLDDLSQCHPAGFTCANGVCTMPAGFPQVASGDVLPVIPIINLVFGVDFRLPDVKGWEAKLEVGFYDAFFAGLGVGYTF